MALSDPELRRGGVEGPLKKPKSLKTYVSMTAWFYILRLKSGQLYIGSTTDLDQRYKDHCSGRACRTTKLDPPVSLLHCEEFETFSVARRREAQVKRWSRAKKEALVYRNTAKLRTLAKSHQNQRKRK